MGNYAEELPCSIFVCALAALSDSYSAPNGESAFFHEMLCYSTSSN